MRGIIILIEYDKKNEWSERPWIVTVEGNTTKRLLSGKIRSGEFGKGGGGGGGREGSLRRIGTTEVAHWPYFDEPGFVIFRGGARGATTPARYRTGSKVDRFQVELLFRQYFGEVNS